MVEVNTNFAVDMMKTMYGFAREKKFTDFKVKAGGRTAHCHQSVICSKSTFFHALCSTGNQEAILDHPISKEEHGEVLESVVQFLYLGNCNITTHNVIPLLLAADFIQLAELKNKCGYFMATNLTTGNLLTYHKLAKQTRLSELCDECVRLSKNNFSEVARSDWVLELSADELHYYLRDDELKVMDENEMITVLERWLKNCRNPTAITDQLLEQLFPCVRTQFCSRAILEAMSKDTAVTGALRFKILEYLHHGFHGEGTARPSYSAACRARQERGVSGNLPPPAALGTSAAGKPATPGTAGTSPPSRTGPARKRPTPSTGTTGSLHKLPKPSTSAVRPVDVQEEILILGGSHSDNTQHKNIIFLDKEPDNCILSEFPIFTTCELSSVCASRDALIVSGGLDLSTRSSTSRVQLYDVNGNTWTDLPNLPHPVHRHGSALVDGNFYSIGGVWNEKGAMKRLCSIHRLMMYTQSATWLECGNLHVAVSSPGVATVKDDILVIGGWTDSGYSTQTCRYNTTTNQMTECEPMPKTDDVVYNSTVAVDHIVYTLAGNLFLAYDVQSDQWSKLPRPMKPPYSSSPAMVPKHNTLIAIGGVVGGRRTDRVQVYDIETKKWTVRDSTMPLKLSEHWAFVMKFNG